MELPDTSDVQEEPSGETPDISDGQADPEIEVFTQEEETPEEDPGQETEETIRVTFADNSGNPYGSDMDMIVKMGESIVLSAGAGFPGTGRQRLEAGPGYAG